MLTTEGSGVGGLEALPQLGRAAPCPTSSTAMGVVDVPILSSEKGEVLLGHRHSTISAPTKCICAAAA